MPQVFVLCFLLIAFLSPSLLQASEKKPSLWRYHCFEGAEMGTPFKICLYVKKEQESSLSADIKSVFVELRKIDAWMSEWRPETALSQLNQRAGVAQVQVPPKLFSIIEYALYVSRESEGAFDPTFNAFWGLYNFKKGKTRKPSEKEVVERLPLINYRAVKINPSEHIVFLQKKGMKLGLGGLGQGYGVDQVVKFLKRKYRAGFVDGSGDLYFWGKKPNGELWTTAIRDPRDHQKNIARVYGTDFAITTCGDDEKFFVDEDGRRIHHILDPKTGLPSRASRQTTVIAKTAMAADAFDTAVFVMGPKKGRKLIERLGMQAIFVTDDEVLMTSGLKNKDTAWGQVLVVDKELR